MKRNQVISESNQHLSNNEVLKALNLILTYLNGKDSHLEVSISDLRTEFIELKTRQINQSITNYTQELEKLKSRIRLCLQDLPEIKGDNAPNTESTSRPSASDQNAPETMWAFIWRILKDAKAISIVLGLVLLTLVVIRLSGRDPFCLIFNDCVSSGHDTTIISVKTWAEDQASKNGGKYALLSIIQHISFEDVVENNVKIRRAFYRNTYTLRALRDISLKDDVFLEQYVSSGGPDLVEQWAGSERQDVQSVTDKKYWVHFEAKKNEIKTLITGANYRYTLPLQNSNSTTCFSNMHLANDEWMVCYPNDEDFVDRLTILVEAQNFNIVQTANAAYRKNSVPPTSDAFCHVYPDGNQRCTMVANWGNLKPGDCAALKIKWSLP